MFAAKKIVSKTNASPSFLKSCNNYLMPRSNIHSTTCLQKGLSPQTVAMVKATAPVIAEHGYAITKAMYKKMLAENPKVKELFNPTHQLELNGQKAHQPQTLAASVHAYAANIDNLGALTEVVERIAQKHVSLYVLPEHYPIVGQNLLSAIKEVLGDAATKEVLDAWGEAYFFLADIFINRERILREEKENAAGGWKGWRKFAVTKKEIESDIIHSFYFKPKDGGKCLSYKPGQYIALRVALPDGTITQRNYTLSKSPGEDTYRITVKREENGKVSSYLHTSVNIGAELNVGVPMGDFFLEITDNKPIVLISGGVGLTPVLSMLEYLVDNKIKNKVIMINAARNPKVEAMHGLLAKYRRKHLNIMIKTVYDEGSDDYPKGPLDMDQLNDVLITRDCHYYVCGPEGFMRSMVKGLNSWKIPTAQINYEFFGPHDDLSS